MLLLESVITQIFNKHKTLTKSFVTSQLLYLEQAQMFHSRYTKYQINKIYESVLRLACENFHYLTFKRALGDDKFVLEYPSKDQPECCSENL